MFNETLRIERIARTQGGRYYCKAENGVGVPAIKSIRVDVQCELALPVCPGPSLSILASGDLLGLRLGRVECHREPTPPWRTVDTSSSSRVYYPMPLTLSRP